jgi:predicted peptidase
VFLLSYSDVKNVDYGYTSKSMIKSRSFTSYATVQGCRPSGEGATLDGDPACFYMLRSAGEKNYGICGVNKKGTVVSSISSFSLTESSDGLAVNGDFGVLPALNIRVGKTASGVWEDFTYTYTDSNGDDAEMSCSLYVPSNYTGDKKLPLITYIPDSTYVGSTLKQYKTAQCPTNWLTEEKMTKDPTFFLVIQFTKTSSGTGSDSQGGQVINIIDSVVNNYWVDESRLYLTGQSMGGILDFALNDAYPDKFAATVYVGCQPGGDVGDDQYNSIISNGKFKDQKFVYIASRKDEKAPYGQDAVEGALIDGGITYGKLYGLDHNGGDGLNSAVEQVLAQGYSQNFFGFTQVTSTGDGTAEHMQSFKYAYAIDAIFDWLMAQHK